MTAFGKRSRVPPPRLARFPSHAASKPAFSSSRRLPPVERAEPADAARRGPDPPPPPHGIFCAETTSARLRRARGTPPEEGRSEREQTETTRERGGAATPRCSARGAATRVRRRSRTPAARARAHNRKRRRGPLGRRRSGDGPRKGTDPPPQRLRAVRHSVPSRTRSSDATRSAFSSPERLEDPTNRRLFRFRSRMPRFRSPVERAEPERGRLARRGAVARGAESDEAPASRAAGDGGPRVFVPVRARRRRGRVRLRDRPWVVTTRRVRVRGRSDVFRVFRV